MKEEIPKLKQMMKDLATLKEKLHSESVVDMVKTITEDIKELIEILNYYLI